MKRKAEEEAENPNETKRIKSEISWTFDASLAHRRLHISKDGTTVTGPEVNNKTNGKVETMAVMSKTTLEDGKIHKWSIRVENEVPKYCSRNWIRIGVGCMKEFLTSSKDYNPVKGKSRHEHIYEVRTCNVKPNMIGDKFQWSKGDIAECTLDLASDKNSFSVEVKRQVEDKQEVVGRIKNRNDLNIPDGGFHPFVRIYPRDQVTLIHQDL
jgi:hypothetical protein